MTYHKHSAAQVAAKNMAGSAWIQQQIQNKYTIGFYVNDIWRILQVTNYNMVR